MFELLALPFKLVFGLFRLGFELFFGLFHGVFSLVFGLIGLVIGLGSGLFGLVLAGALIAFVGAMFRKGFDSVGKKGHAQHGYVDVDDQPFESFYHRSGAR